MKAVKIRKIVLGFLFLTVFFCFTASCLAQTKDFWLKIERKGTGFGYEHISIRQLQNGYYEYELDTHTKLDFFGVTQDVIQKGTYIVDANLLPVSFDLYLKFRAKDEHVTGKYDDGLMHLTIEDEEAGVRKREVPFKDTYFNVVLGDLILRREKEKIFNLKIFDPTNLRVESTQVKVTKSGAKEIEATVTDILTKKYRIDRQGQISQIEFVELHIRAYLTDAEDARNISYLNTADGYTLTVQSKKSFPNVYKVAQARIQVKWKDIPFEEFNFEDDRQKVMRRITTNGEYEVVLEFTKATADSKGVIAPVVDEKFAAFLKDTDFIKPSDPSIQRQLAEIRGDEKDAFTITNNILHWISANITADLIAETLTGPEVLKKRRGKCSEYAILFASLARAAGIPAKVALGEQNIGNRWMGHMWNEVWLGEWMTVDPSAGIFVTGPSLVKFVDSPTVMGTQRVRNKLVDNLSLEILDFTEEEITTSTELKTGIFNGTYFNKAFACKISAPDTAWDISEEKKAGIPTILMKPKEEENVTFALVLFPLPPGMSSKSILDTRVNAISGMVKNFKKLEEGQIQIAGRTVPRVVFQQSAKDQLILVNENCLLVEGTNGYLFAFITPEDRFIELRASLQKILESFEIVK